MQKLFSDKCSKSFKLISHIIHWRKNMRHLKGIVLGLGLSLAAMSLLTACNSTGSTEAAKPEAAVTQPKKVHKHKHHKKVVKQNTSADATTEGQPAQQTPSSEPTQQQGATTDTTTQQNTSSDTTQQNTNNQPAQQNTTDTSNSY